MAHLNEVTVISFDETTDSLAVQHKNGPSTFLCTNGQKLKFTRAGNFWDLEINPGKVTGPKFTANLLKNHANISFASISVGGNWYYVLNLIGEEDIRDGYKGQGNVFQIGMLTEVSITSGNGQITILKA